MAANRQQDIKRHLQEKSRSTPKDLSSMRQSLLRTDTDGISKNQAFE